MCKAFYSILFSPCLLPNNFKKESVLSLPDCEPRDSKHFQVRWKWSAFMLLMMSQHRRSSPEEPWDTDLYVNALLGRDSSLSGKEGGKSDREEKTNPGSVLMSQCDLVPLGAARHGLINDIILGWNEPEPELEHSPKDFMHPWPRECLHSLPFLPTLPLTMSSWTGGWLAWEPPKLYEQEPGHVSHTDNLNLDLHSSLWQTSDRGKVLALVTSRMPEGTW